MSENANVFHLVEKRWIFNKRFLWGMRKSVHFKCGDTLWWSMMIHDDSLFWKDCNLCKVSLLYKCLPHETRTSPYPHPSHLQRYLTSKILFHEFCCYFHTYFIGFYIVFDATQILSLIYHCSNFTTQKFWWKMNDFVWFRAIFDEFLI